MYALTCDMREPQGKSILCFCSFLRSILQLPDRSRLNCILQRKTCSCTGASLQFPNDPIRYLCHSYSSIQVAEIKQYSLTFFECIYYEKFEVSMMINPSKERQLKKGNEVIYQLPLIPSAAQEGSKPVMDPQAIEQKKKSTAKSNFQCTKSKVRDCVFCKFLGRIYWSFPGEV